MNYNFWVPLLINLVGLYLAHRQVKLMEAQAGITPVAKFTSGVSVRRYWPMGMMTVLMLSCWIPYFLSDPKPVPDIFLSYGFNGARIYATLRTSELVSKRPNRLMIIARVEDNSINYEADTEIARSATFEIQDPSTAIEVTPPPSFKNKPGLIDIYAFLVSEEFPFERVNSMADAKRLGAKLIGSHGFGGGAIIQPIR
jgi:hypothetical protein